MKPYEKAREVWDNPEHFYAMLDGYMEHGFIYSGDDAFAMAMPHCVDLLMKQNLNNNVDKRDCWFVQYVTGSLERLMDLLEGLPNDFKWVVFERDDIENRHSDETKYKVYEIERLKRKVHGKS